MVVLYRERYTQFSVACMYSWRLSVALVSLQSLRISMVPLFSVMFELSFKARLTSQLFSRLKFVNGVIRIHDTALVSLFWLSSLRSAHGIIILNNLNLVDARIPTLYRNQSVSHATRCQFASTSQ